MNIEESNKLIAEFMGYQECHVGLFRMGDEFQLVNVFSEYQEEDEYLTIESGSRVIKFSPSEMLFHSDWSWLMPVIKKVTDRHDQHTYFHIGHLYDDLKCSLYNVNIKETYKLIIKCIRWYNENHPNKK